MVITNNKFNGNMEELLHIKNPESAYMLGFLWADGYVSKNHCQLKIAEKDFNEIKGYFHHLGKFSYKYSERREATWQDTGEARLSDTVFARKLIELGFSTKSYDAPSKILKIIPKRMHHLFWRGYFDGDGSIILCKKYLCATVKFGSTIEQDWSGLIEMLENNEIYHYKIDKYVTKKGHRSSTLSIRRRDDILRLFYYLYRTNPDVCLNRKYLKWVDYINRVNKTNNTNFLLRKEIRNNSKQILTKINRNFGESLLHPNPTSI